MPFDPETNAGRIHISSSTAKNKGYSGTVILDMARILAKNPNITETDLASNLSIDPGYNNSGVGDLKRLVLSIFDIVTRPMHQK